jgi:hypothetical protein
LRSLSVQFCPFIVAYCLPLTFSVGGKQHLNRPVAEGHAQISGVLAW